MTLQEQMIKYRAKHNLSQQELADLIGITKQTVWAIENDKQQASKVTEAKIRLKVGEDDESIDFALENI